MELRLIVYRFEPIMQNDGLSEKKQRIQINAITGSCSYR